MWRVSFSVCAQEICAVDLTASGGGIRRTMEY